MKVWKVCRHKILPLPSDAEPDYGDFHYLDCVETFLHLHKVERHIALEVKCTLSSHVRRESL